MKIFIKNNLFAGHIIEVRHWVRVHALHDTVHAGGRAIARKAWATVGARIGAPQTAHARKGISILLSLALAEPLPTPTATCNFEAGGGCAQR